MHDYPEKVPVDYHLSNLILITNKMVVILHLNDMMMKVSHLPRMDTNDSIKV